MPSYEMPLEEMKEYRGSSPCPKDFDTYWSDALAELDAVKPEPVLKPAAFQAAGLFLCFYKITVPRILTSLSAASARSFFIILL